MLQPPALLKSITCSNNENRSGGNRKDQNADHPWQLLFVSPRIPDNNTSHFPALQRLLSKQNNNIVGLPHAYYFD
jgi:hypothetical protein